MVDGWKSGGRQSSVQKALSTLGLAGGGGAGPSRQAFPGGKEVAVAVFSGSKSM